MILLVLFANIWIWKIFSFSFFTGFLVLLASFLVVEGFKKNKITKLLLFIFMLLCVSQYILTSVEDLTALTINQKLAQIRRPRLYPPSHIPFAHWFEERKETQVIYRLTENFSESLDLNLYFFASHPRETDRIESFEKFPYILAPFFVIGFLRVVESRKYKLIFLTLIIPIIFLTAIGNRNPIGPFILFPFFILCISHGLRLLSKRYLFLFLVFYSLVFVQTIIYATK